VLAPANNLVFIKQGVRMPQIQIRPVTSADIPHLIALDHDYTSDYVWQMDLQQEEGQVKASVYFRQVRLPRSARVEYPRPPRQLADDWQRRAALLAAVLEDKVAGYISLAAQMAPNAAWVTDLAVMRRVRRQGIGTGLLLAGMAWAKQHSLDRLVVEMQPKNYPALCMMQKLGFVFCGYQDPFYTNRDIALFFSKPIR
jgi:ribosomal protein S18 acetylase RimI-like enzyme